MAQERFELLGTDLMVMIDKLSKSKTLARLLYYSDENPLAEDKADIDGSTLIHKNLRVVPLIPDNVTTKESYVVVLFDGFYINPANGDFVVNSVRFDVICPLEAWVINDTALRPYKIMNEIDKLFNKKPLSGFGKMSFSAGNRLVVSPQLGGYTLIYNCDEFN